MRVCDRIVLVAATLLGTALAPQALQAGSKDGRFAVEEAGRATCATFVRAREQKLDAYARYVGFIEGYMTAANRYEPNTFDLTPWHNAAAFALILDQHCRKHPEQTMVMVAQNLVIAMQPYRLADYSGMLEVRGDGKQARVYATILKRAQFELGRKGFYHGARDGQFSPTMKSALIEFQKKSKLDATGLPDPATLWVLLSP